MYAMVEKEINASAAPLVSHLLSSNHCKGHLLTWQRNRALFRHELFYLQLNILAISSFQGLLNSIDVTSGNCSRQSSILHLIILMRCFVLRRIDTYGELKLCRKAGLIVKLRVYKLELFLHWLNKLRFLLVYVLAELHKTAFVCILNYFYPMACSESFQTSTVGLLTFKMDNLPFAFVCSMCLSDKKISCMDWTI